MTVTRIMTVGVSLTDQERTKLFKREVLLIVLGAFLAGIPTLLSTYMQTTSEVRRHVLDNKITALKDFIVCNNKITTAILPQIDSFISDAEDYRAASQRASFSFSKGDLSKLKAKSETISLKSEEFFAELNSVHITANILFGQSFKLTEEVVENQKPLPLNKKGEEIPDAKYIEKFLAETIQSSLHEKKRWQETYNTNNKTIRQLSSQIAL